MKDITITNAHQDFLEAGFKFTSEYTTNMVYHKDKRPKITFDTIRLEYSVAYYECDTAYTYDIDIKLHTLIHNMLKELGWVE